MRAETNKAKLAKFMTALREMFASIRPQLIRYPAIEPASFERAVVEFCDANP